MADPKDINLKPLTSSLNGDPVLIASIAVATPTVAHTHSGGTTDADLVTLLCCNTDVVGRTVTVICYTGTPSSPANVLAIVKVPATNGPWVLLDGHWLSGGHIIGLICDVANVVTFHGKAPKATLTT